MNTFDIGDTIEFSRNGETIIGKIINLDEEKNLIQIKSTNKMKIYSLPIDNLQYTEKTEQNKKIKVVTLTGFNALDKNKVG